jgi:site-specific recombinase XerD
VFFEPKSERKTCIDFFGDTMTTSLIPASPTFDYSAIDRADLQPTTRIKYKRAISLLLSAGVNPLNYDALQSYADSLSNSSRGFLKAALKVTISEEVNRIKAQATPGNMQAIQALVARIEAMDSTIKVHQPKGEKSHLWLTPEQVEQLTSLPDRSTVQGRRDWIILALLLSGLRRQEVATITFDRLQRRPMSNGQLRAVLDVTGKGAKDRTVPIKPLLEKYLTEWHTEIGDGCIARAINKSGRINGSLSTNAIYDIVQRYGAMIGLPDLQPHDLRRTYAEIGWINTHDLVLVSTLLGHSDTATTQKYLNLKVNLDRTISDFVPLSGD